MASIDDRIVNMQFNNSQFQQGISETNASLQELQNNLKLTGGASGFDAAQAAANRFSLSNIENSLNNISSKFSIFGVSAFTIIQDLTNKVIGFGSEIGHALVDPIVQGGEARALALQKAQFQFRGLGLDVQQTMLVAKNAVLGTAFSLDQAATAAGQLGASGVTAGHGLEGALRGIAGLAAQTGSSFDSISQIFIKVAGNGRLMGQDLLQLSANGVNAAATLAKAMGIPEAKVRDLVTQGKISFKQFSDAMGEAFGDNAKKANELFTGALANMRAALARLGAEFEGPKLFALRDIFNAMSPLIDNVHQALLPLINDFNNIQNSGAATVVEAISHLLGPGIVASIQNVVQAIEGIGKAIAGGFGEIFPSDTAAQLTSVSVFLQKFTAALIPSAKAAGELKRTFAGVFAVFDILGQVIHAVVNTFADLFGIAAPAGDSFLTISAKVGDFLVKVDELLKKGQFIQTFFKTLGQFVAVPIALLQTFFGIVADGVKDLGLFSRASKGMDDFSADVEKRFSALIDLGNFFITVMHTLVGAAIAVYNFLKPVFVAIGTAVQTAVGNVMDSFKGLSFTDAIQVLNTGIFAAFVLIVRGFFGNIGGIVRGNTVAFVAQFKTIMTSLRVNLKALEINTNAKTLTQIAIAVALLAASAIALSLVDSGKLAASLGVIGGLIVSLIGAFGLFGKIGGTKGILQALALSTALTGIAGAILILSASIAILGALPLGNLVQGTIAIGVVLGILSGALLLLGKAAPQVLAAATAIAIMAPPLILLTGVIAILGALPLLNLVQGMVAFIVVLGALVGALALLSLIGPKVLIGAVAIALIAPAVVLLTGAIAALSALPLPNLVQGVLAFAAVLALLTGAMLLLGLVGPEILIGAVAIAAVSLSMVPLIGAIAALSAIPLDNLVKGMVVFAAALALLVGAILVLGFTGPVALLGAAALVAVALAIAVLAPALILLSTISWDAFGRLMATLAAGLGILVVMGILLIPASVGFLLFGAAILVIGAGIFLAATGVALLAIAIVALVAVGAAGIGLLSAGFAAFIAELPQLGVGIAGALISMAVVIGQKAPMLVDSFVRILLAMLDAINQVVPQLVIVATVIIVSLIDALTILIPLLVQAGLTILEGILKGISDHIERIVELSLLIIANFINGLADGLPSLLQAGANLILSFINGIADTIRNNHAALDKAILNLADALTGGLSTGILKGAGQVIRAIQKVAADAIDAAKKLLGIHSPSKVFDEEIGQQMGAGMGNGLIKSTANVVAKAKDMGVKSTNAVKDTISGLGASFGDNVDIQPTIRPVVDLSNLQNASKQIPGLLQAPTLSLDTSNNVATSVSLQEQARNAQIVLDASKTPVNGNGDVTFIQNNNSPKALSTVELYRQTRNQLSTLKGDLGVVDQSGSS